MKKVTLLLIIILQATQFFAQDSTDIPTPLLKKDLKFKYEALIIPATLVGFGVIGLESESIKNINNSTRDEIKGASRNAAISAAECKTGQGPGAPNGT